MFEQAVEDQQEAAPDRRIALECIGDLEGDWDAVRLSQVAFNLIGNAIQHGDSAHGIDGELDGRDPGTVILSITNGGAIPAAKLPTVFDPFRSREAHRSRGDGLGLGLYIVEQIARAHGGRVEVQSDATTTTFRVTLPRTRVGDPTPPRT